jgi:hypothetical protein
MSQKIKIFLPIIFGLEELGSPAWKSRLHQEQGRGKIHWIKISLDFDDAKLPGFTR